MAIRKFTVRPVTGTATATAYSPWFSGYIESIQYVKDGSNAYAAGVDITITSDVTGEAILGKLTDQDTAFHLRPRAPTHGTDGVAATYDGSEGVFDRIALSRDRVKILIEQGGNGKAGQFNIFVDDGR